MVRWTISASGRCSCTMAALPATNANRIGCPMHRCKLLKRNDSPLREDGKGGVSKLKAQSQRHCGVCWHLSSLFSGTQPK